MTQQNTTTGGTNTPPADLRGKEVKLSPNAIKKDLGNGKFEVTDQGQTFIARFTPNGRVVRDS